MQEQDVDIQGPLETLYREIEVTRMDGVPILNTELSVAAIGFDRWQEYYLGVLVTPWFMNLMLLPQIADVFSEENPRVGDKRKIQLPAGQVEFIVGHEDGLGFSLSCSLFSPMFEFADQAAAEETAQVALEQVLTSPDADEPDEDADMRDIWAGKLPEPEPQEEVEADEPQTAAPSEPSRRDLLRGSVSGAVAEEQL